MLSGDNGILQKATDAKTQTEIGQEKEIVALAYNSALAKKVGNGDSTPVTYEDMNTELTNQGATANGNNPIKVTFTASKRQYTVNNGIVNYSGIKSDDNSDYAPYDNPYIPTNFSHIGTENWNQGYTIKGNTGTANENDEFVWVPCVLDQAKVKSGDTVQTFRKILTEKYITYSLTVSPLGETNQNLNAEDATVEEIRTSVGKYGGFYIAKYEAGIDGTTDNAKSHPLTATDGSVKPLSQAGKGVWNEITRVDSLTVAKAMIPTSTGAKSTLISGECWDTTLAWITATSDSSYAENSTNKGNYTGSYPTNGLTTGYYGTNTNNIFDLGGNVYELTSENCIFEEESDGDIDIYQGAVARGGSYDFSHPASVCHGFGELSRSNFIGFRVVIYK